MKAWHFCELEDGKLITYQGDPRLLIPMPLNGEPGEWLEHVGEVLICEKGLHASKAIMEALRYSRGFVICRVEVRDIVDQQADKVVARQRRVLWWVDGEDLLRRFARLCALDVVSMWDPPEVVLQWLWTGDERYRGAAWSAAWSAAESAAWSAAESAAESAAYSAAERAAKRAAKELQSRQSRRLLSMVLAEHRRMG